MNRSEQAHPGEIVSDRRYSLTELCEICRLESTFVVDMIDYDVITPVTPAGELFNHTQLTRVMKAWRLQRDLDLNSPGIALAMQLLEQIEVQERELKLLRQQTGI